MEEAHTGLIADPSRYTAGGTNSCSEMGCHETLAGQYKNSLHQMAWGERKMIATRSGVSDFEDCPQSTKDGFNGECSSCHATCGDCHISIPNSAGQGLINNHRFMETPDPADNCMACHGSRIAHDFLGDYEIYPARPRDVHANSMSCLDCHTKTEMHSEVAENTDRYQYEHLPSCEDGGCHDDVSNVNHYHQLHYDDLTCYVCHSQEYNNCTDCHVNNEWKTDPEYQNNNPVEDFRIGLNPLKEETGRIRPQKFATLRHIPIAPASYSNWGPASATLPSYNSLPSWKFTSPHSIRRYTARTDTSGGKGCRESCHIGTGGDSANVKYYLTREYVEQNWPDEVDANEDVFVDGNLPSGWE